MTIAETAPVNHGRRLWCGRRSDLRQRGRIDSAQRRKADQNAFWNVEQSWYDVIARHQKEEDQATAVSGATK